MYGIVMIASALVMKTDDRKQVLVFDSQARPEKGNIHFEGGFLLFFDQGACLIVASKLW